MAVTSRNPEMNLGDAMTKRRESNRWAAQRSRARRKEYIANLEKAVRELANEKFELSIQAATLTSQVWEQSVRIKDLEKELELSQLGF
eukprot:m51a1_g1406 hypothetical protein (88) ;mRNA; f:511405-511732